MDRDSTTPSDTDNFSRRLAGARTTPSNATRPQHARPPLVASLARRGERRQELWSPIRPRPSGRASRELRRTLRRTCAGALAPPGWVQPECPRTVLGGLRLIKRRPGIGVDLGENVTGAGR